MEEYYLKRVKVLVGCVGDGVGRIGGIRWALGGFVFGFGLKGWVGFVFGFGVGINNN